MSRDSTLSPELLHCADVVRQRFPRRVGNAVVADVEALACRLCASLEEYPLSAGVLACTVFLEGRCHTAIQEGLRRRSPERWRFTLAHEEAEILLHRYLSPVTDRDRRERICDAFAAEMLLPARVVADSVSILAGACGGRACVDVSRKEELARVMSRTYGVSVTTARISISQSLAEAV